MKIILDNKFEEELDLLAQRDATVQEFWGACRRGDRTLLDALTHIIVNQAEAIRDLENFNGDSPLRKSFPEDMTFKKMTFSLADVYDQKTLAHMEKVLNRTIESIYTDPDPDQVEDLSYPEALAQVPEIDAIVESRNLPELLDWLGKLYIAKKASRFSFEIYDTFHHDIAACRAQILAVAAQTQIIDRNKWRIVIVSIVIFSIFGGLSVWLNLI